MLDEFRKRKIRNALGDDIDIIMERMNCTSDYKEKVDLAVEVLNRLYKLLR